MEKKRTPDTGWLTARGIMLLAAALMFMSVQPAMAATITDANVAEHIASAKTAADHEALAAYFKAQAAAAAEKVKTHEAMVQAMKKAGGKLSFAQEHHCQSLVTAYKNVEEEAEGMAQEHERMAKEAGK